MNVLYLSLSDRVPHTARQQLQHRSDHSTNCTFWLWQHRAVMQRFRSNVRDMDRGMAAARHIERREPMPATKADRVQRLLIRTFGRSVIKLRRPQKLSQQQQLGDMADLSPHAFGSAERRVANVIFDVVAHVAAYLGTILAELLTDNHQIEISDNCYLDEHVSPARL
jgi:hypothetical protein